MNKTRKDLKEIRLIIIDEVRLTKSQNEINNSFFNTPSNNNPRIEIEKTCIVANNTIDIQLNRLILIVSYFS